jgi:hypothetical protein
MTLPSNEDRYLTALQANVRALWSSAITRAQFISLMIADIEFYLLLAAAEGAEEEDLVGLWDLTFEEAMAMQEIIWMQYMFIDRFADEIVERNEAAGFPLGPFIRRTEIWKNRYGQAREKIRLMAKADGKSRWNLLWFKEHCASCLKLNGIVKRNTLWLESGILPRVAGAPYLECQGFLCGCSLKPTSAAVTPGPLPPLP